MADDKQEQLRNLVIFKGGLQPTFKNYRNPQDDPIRNAIQEAAKQLRAEGKPLINGSPADETA